MRQQNQYRLIILRAYEAKKKNNPFYSLRALARDVGIPQSTLIRFLGHKIKLSPNHLYSLGLYLKIPKNELIDFIFEFNETEESHVTF
jgi:hypothetical protein